MKRFVEIAAALCLALAASTTQAAQVCGNGVIEYPEACDDGNTVGGDACAADCGVLPETSTIAVSSGLAYEGNDSLPDPLSVTIARTGTSAFGISFGMRTVQDTALDGPDYEGFFDGQRYYLPSSANAVLPNIRMIGDVIAELDEMLGVEIYGAYRTGAITMVANAATEAAGDGPYRLAVADLNDDGLLDVVTGTTPGNTLGVLRNTSSPGSVDFAAVSSIASTSPYGIAVGDLDGDGNPDLAATNFNGGGLSTLRHVTAPGTAAFEAAQTLTTTAGLHSLVIADFDGDGKADVAGANFPEDQVYAWRNTSTVGTIALTAAAAPFATGDGPYGITAADIDGDGKLDIVAPLANADKAVVLRNTSTAGTISFAAAETFATGDFSTGVAVADFDGDGKLDVATSNASANTVSVLRNTSTSGTVSFATQVPYALSGSAAYFLAAGDVDGDQLPDLAVASFSGSKVMVLRNTSTIGTLGFASIENVATGTGPYEVAIADFDGDAQADIVTGNAGTGADNITVARNNRPTVAITTASATATILNDDEPLMAFAAETSAADESDGTTTVIVTMLGVSDETVEVSYTLGGTATQGTDYTISPATLSFAPGDTSKTLTISNLADTVDDGAATETIVITLADPSNAGLNPPNPHTLTITNDLTPAWTVAPSSLTFATRTVGTTSAAQSVTVTNTGTVTLTLESAGITGANAGDFAVSGGTCGATLNTASSCTIGVTFTPGAAGARAATLTAGANGLSEEVALSGSGTAVVVDPEPETGGEGGGGGGPMSLGLLLFGLLRRRFSGAP